MKLAVILITALAAGSAQAQTPAWSLTVEKGQPATLVFGADDLTLRCPPDARGQITVDLKIPGAPSNANGDVVTPIPRSVKVTSGLASTTLRGQAPVLGKLGAAFAESEFSTAAPVAETFRKTGQISVSAMDVTQSPPPAKPAMARKFLNVCR
jgi:hypothetical protein